MIKFSGEFELSSEVSESVNEDFYEETIFEILMADFVCALLFEKDVSFSPVKDDCPSVVKIRIDETKDLQRRIFKYSRKGFRLAIAMRDSCHTYNVLEQRGYTKCFNACSGSQLIVRNWEEVLNQSVLDVNNGKCFLIFGHDMDPAFVFEYESV